MLGDWSEAPDAMFRRLADKLRTEIQTGQLPAGAKLPSERALATSLGVSRSTVAAALDQLRGEGLIASRQGSGTRVTRAGVRGQVRGEHRLDTFVGFAANLDHIDLRSAALHGLPIVADVVGNLDSPQLRSLVPGHGYLPEGLPDLREKVADYYTKMDLPTTADQILITSGAQQGLRVLVRALLEAGTPVLIEEPSFRGAIETLRSEGARLSPVPTDEEGIKPAALERAIVASRAKIVFLQATASNPRGSTMSAHRRREIARIADRCGVTIIEDAAVVDACIDETPPPPIAKHCPTSIVLGSASKSFWGGLRVGWIRTTPAIATQLASVKGSEDLGTSLIGQLATAALLPRIDEARLLRRAHLRIQRETLTSALDVYLPEWTYAVPTGGASLWARLPRGNATALAQRAVRQGVSVLPGPIFSSIDHLNEYIRISFAYEPATIAEGVARLAGAWEAYTSEA
ncbi:PLP-dependent aminotransferase family protein [Rhodococcus sp. NPDC059968]|uniref:aminotransferase-like domain-containing protein n=1 Tax=Rhodococcus sp. NPDC059968 TaxID=3347017 RepID=UPI00366F4DB9